MKSKYSYTILRLSIFFVFLVILSTMINFQLLREVLLQVKGGLVALAVAIYLVNIAIRAYRLQVLLNKDSKRITLKDAYLITLIGAALNMVIPATMGDIGRSYYGYKMYGIKEEMLSATLIDKIFALNSLFLLGFFSAFLMGYYWLGLASVFAMILSFLPLTFPRLVPWNLLNSILHRFQKSLDAEKLIETFRLSWSTKYRVMLVSVLGWLCTSVFFYTVCQAFPVVVHFGYVIVIMPILTLVRLFPFTVNALGPTEVAVAYFFSMLEIPPTVAVLISLTANILSSVIPGVLGMGVILTARYK